MHFTHLWLSHLCTSFCTGVSTCASIMLAYVEPTVEASADTITALLEVKQESSASSITGRQSLEQASGNDGSPMADLSQSSVQDQYQESCKRGTAARKLQAHVFIWHLPEAAFSSEAQIARPVGGGGGGGGTPGLTQIKAFFSVSSADHLCHAGCALRSEYTVSYSR